MSVIIEQFKLEGTLDAIYPTLCSKQVPEQVSPFCALNTFNDGNSTGSLPDVFQALITFVLKKKLWLLEFLTFLLLFSLLPLLCI